MVVYVNGDSHSAGAELVKDYCFAEDDKKYLHLGRLPHPEAVPHTFTAYLAYKLNCEYVLDAESASSNDRILRRTKSYLKDNTETFVIIGWTTWEREEVWHEDKYFQLTASGTDSVPEGLEQEYKDWVAEQTNDTLRVKQEYWHDLIYDFHLDLQQQEIKHLFFNSMHAFNQDWVDAKDWQGCYLEPYDQNWTFTTWAKNDGHLPCSSLSNHFGESAHKAWSQILLTKIHNSSIII